MGSYKFVFFALVFVWCVSILLVMFAPWTNSQQEPDSSRDVVVADSVYVTLAKSAFNLGVASGINAYMTAEIESYARGDGGTGINLNAVYAKAEETSGINQLIKDAKK